MYINKKRIRITKMFKQEINGVANGKGNIYNAAGEKAIEGEFVSGKIHGKVNLD